MDTPDQAAIFHEGVRLFNRGEWFDAHEVWEDIWHLASGQHKRFYQGLIQCAVTLEHVRRGNPRGARNVYRSATDKLHDLPDTYFGVPVATLLSDMDQFLQPMMSMPPDAFAPGRGRKGVPIPVDLTAAPRIELIYDPFSTDPPNN